MAAITRNIRIVLWAIRNRKVGNLIDSLNNRRLVAKKMARREEEAKCLDRVKSLLCGMLDRRDEAFLHYRNEHLLQILRHAYQHCPYYRHAMKQTGYHRIGLDMFQVMPLLDKEVIRQHRNEIIADNVQTMDIYRMNTGGSTGAPFDFIVSRVAGLVDHLHQEHEFKTTMNYEHGDLIVALDGSSVPEDLLKKGIFWVDTSDNDLPYGRRSYSSLYLRKSTIDAYVDHLIATSPSILRGYPSVLNELAEHILNEKVAFPRCVKGVELTSENIYDWQVENIKKAFNTNVYFQYGHSEVCVFAYTNDESYRYFCSPLYGHTEVLN